MNSYTQKVQKDLTMILGVEGNVVSQDCLEALTEYLITETRQSFVNGLKRKPRAAYPQSALQAGKLQPVKMSQ